ncbi:MAG TPA: penicillin-binding transpeptidase domain-containing protein, partial [Prosthecobacter sp.]|nr:penicillin-binding transpeptidase domain-containing protein [Prosthecobacter sp.]
FAGPMSAAEALFRSRNIPAVALTQKLAAPGLYGFLKQAGVAFPRSAHHYGLALPLGGAEVSLEELARLYTMVVNDGCMGSLRFTSEVKPDERRQMLSPAACYMVREMLRQTDVEQGADDPAVSWKTGTSHGFRDAWAAGMRGEFVLVVWIGNFNGKSNASFVARECAAPLLFEMFRRLRLPYSKAAKPEGVTEVDLCAVSGQLPTPLCPHRLRGGFVPGVSPIQPCAVHQEVLTDRESGLRVVADDGRPGLKREVYECWPPDLLALFKQAGLPRKEPPAFEKSGVVLDGDTGQMPKIASPRESLVYHVRTTQAAQRGIPLRADAAPGVRKVYWFAGSQFIGSGSPAEPLLWEPVAGKWTLHVLDDHGRTASCQVRVEAVQ